MPATAIPAITVGKLRNSAGGNLQHIIGYHPGSTGAITCRWTADIIIEDLGMPCASLCGIIIQQILAAQGFIAPRSDRQRRYLTVD
jgi:hypothetical protein